MNPSHLGQASYNQPRFVHGAALSSGQYASRVQGGEAKQGYMVSGHPHGMYPPGNGRLNGSYVQMGGQPNVMPSAVGMSMATINTSQQNMTMMQRQGMNFKGIGDSYIQHATSNQGVVGFNSMGEGFIQQPVGNSNVLPSFGHCFTNPQQPTSLYQTAYHQQVINSGQGQMGSPVQGQMASLGQGQQGFGPGMNYDSTFMLPNGSVNHRMQVQQGNVFRPYPAVSTPCRNPVQNYVNEPSNIVEETVSVVASCRQAALTTTTTVTTTASSSFTALQSAEAHSQPAMCPTTCNSEQYLGTGSQPATCPPTCNSEQYLGTGSQPATCPTTCNSEQYLGTGSQPATCPTTCNSEQYLGTGSQPATCPTTCNSEQYLGTGSQPATCPTTCNSEQYMGTGSQPALCPTTCNSEQYLGTGSQPAMCPPTCNSEQYLGTGSQPMPAVQCSSFPMNATIVNTTDNTVSLQVPECDQRVNPPSVQDGASSTSRLQSIVPAPYSDGEKCVVVPFGWQRVIEDGCIVYYSPSQTRLPSVYSICQYLSTNGTCKCGLECPILVHKLFNFDPQTPAKQWTVNDVSCSQDLTKLCNHKRKLVAMATFQSSRHTPIQDCNLQDKFAVELKCKTRPKGKKEPKARKKNTKAKALCNPYDGVLVSQLIAEREKSKAANYNSEVACPQGQTEAEGPDEELQLQNGPSVQQPEQLIMPELSINNNLVNQPASSPYLKLGNCPDFIPGQKGRDPMDDLGPITCQIPAKLDFSQEQCLAAQFPNGPAQFQNGPRAMGHHLMNFQANQQFAQQQHMKSPMFIQQSPYRQSPNNPVNFNPLANQPQSVDTLQMQNSNFSFTIQGTGNFTMQQNANFAFQAANPRMGQPLHPHMTPIMHLQQNDHRFAGPMFAQAQVQGNVYQVGIPGHPMYNNAYPQSNDGNWNEPAKQKVKRTRAKRERKKYNTVLEPSSHCPNIDIRHMNSPKVSPPKVKMASFLENPTAFLAQQTEMVNNSIASMHRSPLHFKSPTNAPAPQYSQCHYGSKGIAPEKSPTLTTPRMLQRMSSRSDTSCSGEANRGCMLENGCETSSADTSTHSCPSSDSLNSAAQSSHHGDQQMGDAERSSNVEGERLDSNSAQQVGNNANSVVSNTSLATQTSSSPISSPQQTNPQARATLTPVPRLKHLPKLKSMPDNLKQTYIKIASGPQNEQSFHESNMQEQMSNSGTPVNVFNKGGSNNFPASSLLSAAARAQVVQQTNQGQLNMLIGSQMIGSQTSAQVQFSLNQDISPQTINGQFQIQAKSEVVASMGNKAMTATSNSAQQVLIQQALVPNTGYLQVNPPSLASQSCNAFCMQDSDRANLQMAQHLLPGMDQKLDPQALDSIRSCLSLAALSNAPSEHLASMKQEKASDWPLMHMEYIATQSNDKQSSGFQTAPKFMGIPNNMVPMTGEDPCLNPMLLGQGSMNILSHPMPVVSNPNMPLPVVTNVANTIAQVIPAVGLSQSAVGLSQSAVGLSQSAMGLSQSAVGLSRSAMGLSQPVMQMVNTLGIPNLNNSMLMAGQMVGTDESQQVTASNGAMSDNPAQTTNDSSKPLAELIQLTNTQNTGLCAATMPNAYCSPDNGQMISSGQATAPALVQTATTATTQVVFVPNMQMPVLQVMGTNPQADKPCIPQLYVPNQNMNMQSVVGPPHMPSTAPQIAMPQQNANPAQVWNGLSGMNVTSVQVQTLQLQQQLLQQMQGMQALLSQLQGVASHGSADGIGKPAEPAMPGQFEETKDPEGENNLKTNEREVDGSAEKAVGPGNTLANDKGEIIDADDAGPTGDNAPEECTSPDVICSPEIGGSSPRAIETDPFVRQSNEITEQTAQQLCNQLAPMDVKLEASAPDDQVMDGNAVDGNISGMDAKFAPPSSVEEQISALEGGDRPANATSCQQVEMKQVTCDKWAIPGKVKELPVIEEPSSIEVRAEVAMQVTELPLESKERAIDDANILMKTEITTSGSEEHESDFVFVNPEQQTALDLSRDHAAFVPHTKTLSVDVRPCGNTDAIVENDKPGDQSRSSAEAESGRIVDASDGGGGFVSDEIPSDIADGSVDIPSAAKSFKRHHDTSVDDTWFNEDYSDESCDSPEYSYPRTFEIGDLVWGQIRGFPSWPGKVVNENEVRSSHKTEEDKVWVKWFGDHTYTQVDPNKLKTLSEGLDAHHRARKRNRKGRKMNCNLEAAIQEAMNELDKKPDVDIDIDSAASKMVSKNKVVKKRKIRS